MEANATALGMAFYEQFQKIAGRRTGWAWNLADFERTRVRIGNMDQLREYLQTRKNREGRRAYHLKGCMLNPTGHQTLEFRGPKGSNDADEVLAWAEFLENVVKAANRKSVDGIKFVDLLKGDRITKYMRRLRGWRKLTKADLNKIVNVTALA